MNNIAKLLHQFVNKDKWPEADEKEEIAALIMPLNILLLTASKKYYNDKDTLMDDNTYDKLTEKLTEYLSIYPDLKPRNCVLDKIEVSSDGSIPQSLKDTGKTKYHHDIPMLSLGKVYTLEELYKWLRNLQRKLKGQQIKLNIEPKMDGVACKLIYEYNSLTHCVLRGNGTEGFDLIDSVEMNCNSGVDIVGIPLTLLDDQEIEYLEITGELVVSDAKLREINDVLLRNFSKPYPTPRHAVTGLISARSFQNVEFLMHGINRCRYVHENEDYFNYDKLLEYLERNGIPYLTKDAVIKEAVSPSVEDKFKRIFMDIHEFEKIKRLTFPYTMDGVVIKVTDPAQKAILGEGKKHPNWAIAYKFQPKSGTTVLENVEWNIGKSGIFTPLARFKPVCVGSVWYGFATLHNPVFIEALDLREGDTITIERRGDVIPAITDVVKEGRDENAKKIAIPTTCPHCDHELINTGAKLYCPYRECPGRMEEAILYCTTKDVFNLKKLRLLGTDYIRNLFTIGAVTRPEDFFEKLTVDVLLDTIEKPKTIPETQWRERMQDIVDEIQSVKLDWVKALMSLSIPGVSKSILTTIARNYDLDQLPNLVLKQDGTSLESTQAFKAFEDAIGFKENKESIEFFKKKIKSYK